MEYLKKKKHFLFINLVECNRNYTAPQGRLYGKTLSDCEQYIHVPENYMITLYFATMDFRIEKECTDDTTPLKVSDFGMANVATKI